MNRENKATKHTHKGTIINEPTTSDKTTTNTKQTTQIDQEAQAYFKEQTLNLFKAYMRDIIR